MSTEPTSAPLHKWRIVVDENNEDRNITKEGNKIVTDHYGIHILKDGVHQGGAKDCLRYYIVDPKNTDDKKSKSNKRPGLCDLEKSPFDEIIPFGMMYNFSHRCGTPRYNNKDIIADAELVDIILKVSSTVEFINPGSDFIRIPVRVHDLGGPTRANFYRYMKNSPSTVYNKGGRFPVTSTNYTTASDYRYCFLDSEESELTLLIGDIISESPHQSMLISSSGVIGDVMAKYCKDNNVQFPHTPDTISFDIRYLIELSTTTGKLGSCGRAKATGIWEPYIHAELYGFTMNLAPV
jgi:hypothetical protein